MDRHTRKTKRAAIVMLIAGVLFASLLGLLAISGCASTGDLAKDQQVVQQHDAQVAQLQALLDKAKADTAAASAAAVDAGKRADAELVRIKVLNAQAALVPAGPDLDAIVAEKVQAGLNADKAAAEQAAATQAASLSDLERQKYQQAIDDANAKAAAAQAQLDKDQRQWADVKGGVSTVFGLLPPPYNTFGSLALAGIAAFQALKNKKTAVNMAKSMEAAKDKDGVINLSDPKTAKLVSKIQGPAGKAIVDKVQADAA